MHWRQTRPSGSINRPGKVLILFALLLPVLLGMLGLVLDLGIILTQYRQAHNAADVVAMATALAKLRGASDSSAENLAQTLFAQLDGMGDATLTICLPPTAGSYAGKSGYVEAIVSKPVSTWFIQVLGGSK
ncbi:MAG: TadE/TadG family type IV pilus assembly protein, partial [Bdellovibrionales bacterium]